MSEHYEATGHRSALEHVPCTAASGAMPRTVLSRRALEQSSASKSMKGREDSSLPGLVQECPRNDLIYA